MTSCLCMSLSVGLVRKLHDVMRLYVTLSRISSQITYDVMRVCVLQSSRAGDPPVGGSA